MQLAGLLRAVAVPAEHRVLVESSPETGGEDGFQVDAAVPCRLFGVLDDNAAEVVGALERPRDQLEDLDEMCEVAELVQLAELLRGAARERVVVPPCDLEQRFRSNRAFEVHVQLDLRVRHRANVSAVQSVLVTVHLLAAAVWVGGTVALVFVGVPVVARLEGEARSRSMRLLGKRWRPLGYGALFVLGVTGVPLAANDWDSGSGFRWTLLAKVASAIVLVALAALHDFVLGPRLASEIREGRGPRTRPLLVAVGRAALIFTFLVPILGVALTRLANG